MKKALLLAPIIMLSACASIVEGSSQKITIDTNPPVNISCAVANERGTWNLNSTPGEIEVKRSKSDLKVTCQNSQYFGEISNSSDAESWAAGNLLAGGVIGAGVDAGTGALFSYDNRITVPLRPRDSSSQQPILQRPAQLAPSSPYQAQPYSGPGQTVPVSPNR